MTDQSPTPLQQFAALVSRLAEKNVVHSPRESLAKALTTRVKTNLSHAGHHDAANTLNEATVAAWMDVENGGAAPASEEILAALKTSLGLSKPARHIRQAAPLSLQRTQLAEQLAAALGQLQADTNTVAAPEAKAPLPPGEQLQLLYEQIPQDAKRAHDTAAPARRFILPRTVTATTPAAVSLHDSPHIPNREIADPTRYEKLTVLECHEKMLETPNVHEFLTLYRHYKAKTIEAMAADLRMRPEEVIAYESGEKIPDAKSLMQYQRALGGINYPLLENLVIANRLDLAKNLAHTQKHTNYQGRDELFDTYTHMIHAAMEGLPAAYWEAAIEKHHDARKFGQKRDKPVWEKKIVPFECREDYLRAARLSLSLSPADAGAPIQKDAQFISDLEECMENPNGRDGKKLSMHYRNEMVKKPVPFNMERYQALPVYYNAAEVKAMRQEEAARLTHEARLSAPSAASEGPARR